MKKIFEVKTDLTTEKNADFLKSLGEQDRQEIIDLDLDLGVDVTSQVVSDALPIEDLSGEDLLEKFDPEYVREA